MRMSGWSSAAFGGLTHDRGEVMTEQEQAALDAADGSGALFYAKGYAAGAAEARQETLTEVYRTLSDLPTLPGERDTYRMVDLTVIAGLMKVES